VGESPFDMGGKGLFTGREEGEHLSCEASWDGGGGRRGMSCFVYIVCALRKRGWDGGNEG
jgi:hypothetical protein